MLVFSNHSRRFGRQENLSYKDGEQVSVNFGNTVSSYFVIGNQPKRGGKLVLKKVRTRGLKPSECPDLIVIESDGLKYSEARWRKTEARR